MDSVTQDEQVVQFVTRQGEVFTVDTQDADLGVLYKWRAIRGSNRPNCRYIYWKNRVGTIFLHRLVMARKLGRFLGDSELVDHKDGDEFNLRRDNLRLATHGQNMANRRIHKNNQSGFKGVRLKGGKWRAELRHNRRTLHIGYYDTPEEAAKAYDSMARLIHGEFARTNVDLGLL